MADPLTSSIRDQITALLADEISLLEFQDWLVGATWDIERHADPDVADLTYSSKLALAELSRGDISPTAFRERLRDHIGTAVPSR
ncbi:MAG: hypothetical protein H0V00_11425 [Chloroflexia bacterium]|nr:hypothetical protein [Chloroflexia bacterium]